MSNPFGESGFDHDGGNGALSFEAAPPPPTIKCPAVVAGCDLEFQIYKGEIAPLENAIDTVVGWFFMALAMPVPLEYLA
jgi:hypothetical protein